MHCTSSLLQKLTTHALVACDAFFEFEVAICDDDRGDRMIANV